MTINFCDFTTSPKPQTKPLTSASQIHRPAWVLVCCSDPARLGGLVSFEATTKLCEAVHERLRHSVMKAVPICSLILGRNVSDHFSQVPLSDPVLAWSDPTESWSLRLSHRQDRFHPACHIVTRCPRKIHKPSLTCPSVWSHPYSIIGSHPTNPTFQTIQPSNLQTLTLSGWFWDNMQIVCIYISVLIMIHHHTCQASPRLLSHPSVINPSYPFHIPRYPKDQIHLPRDLGEIGEISEFQDLPPKPLEELVALMKLRLYVPQQVILQQGAPWWTASKRGLGMLVVWWFSAGFIMFKTVWFGDFLMEYLYGDLR